MDARTDRLHRRNTPPTSRGLLRPTTAAPAAGTPARPPARQRSSRPCGSHAPRRRTRGRRRRCRVFSFSTISRDCSGGTTLSSRPWNRITRRPDALDQVDGRALGEYLPPLGRRGAEQAMQIARLELVRVLEQQAQIRNAVVAAAGREDFRGRERHQGRVAAGAAAGDGDARAIGEPGLAPDGARPPRNRRRRRCPTRRRGAGGRRGRSRCCRSS